MLGEGVRLPLRVTATLDGRTGQLDVDTAALSLGLNDVPVDRRIDPAGAWWFSPDADMSLVRDTIVDDGVPTTRLPEHIIFDGLELGDGVATVRRDFDIREGLGQTAYLRSL